MCKTICNKKKSKKKKRSSIVCVVIYCQLKSQRTYCFIRLMRLCILLQRNKKNLLNIPSIEVKKRRNNKKQPKLAATHSSCYIYFSYIVSCVVVLPTRKLSVELKNSTLLRKVVFHILLTSSFQCIFFSFVLSMYLQ